MAGLWADSFWAVNFWADDFWADLEETLNPSQPIAFRVTMHSNPIAMVVRLIDNVGFRTRMTDYLAATVRTPGID